MKHFTLLMLFSLCSFSINAQDIPFKKHKPCSFSIDLPEGMTLNNINEDSNPDYCENEVKLKDGYVIMALNSLNKSRFDYSSIKDLYASAIKETEIDITYKMQSKDYFVISGLNKKNGNIVYWKRCLGKNFISDLKIEYDKTRKNDIEPFIRKISKSFKSD